MLFQYCHVVDPLFCLSVSILQFRFYNCLTDDSAISIIVPTAPMCIYRFLSRYDRTARMAAKQKNVKFSYVFENYR